MTDVEATVVEDALEELVHQFADPLSFYRELIQNALDADSSEIEIRFEHQTDEEGAVTVIHVIDWGIGMTRQIIEARLTRLFSSAKDGDMTKIGKFGIGFVSVFAIAPDAVVVDTAREGEGWRVIFDRQRRYELRRLEEPHEGTHVRIIKAMTRDEHDDFVTRSRRVVEFWCKHSAREIMFDGERITTEFSITAMIKARSDDGFSRIRVGHPAQPGTLGGYYNSGLTLAEHRETRYPGLVYKVMSPHLEHTLTRDAVIENSGYERVHEDLERLVHVELCLATFDALEVAVVARTAGVAHYRAAAWHADRGPKLPKVAERRTVGITAGGRAVSYRELRRACERGRTVYMAPARDVLTDGLEDAGSLVFIGSEVASLVAALPGDELTACHDRFVIAAPAAQPEAWNDLCREVARILDEVGFRVDDVEVGILHGGGLDRVALTSRDPSRPTPVEEAAHLSTSLFSWSRDVVIGANHPLVRRIQRGVGGDPRLAAYQLVKLMFAANGLDAVTDGRLAMAAVGETD